MKKYTRSLLASLLVSAGLLFIAPDASANLIDFGATVYDTDLGISWLKDANLAATNTFGVGGINADGGMNWATAQSWINAMNTANYLSYSDWRLPTVTDTGTPGCNYSFSGTDCGYNVDTAASEMAHLYYDELLNIAAYNTLGTLDPAWVLGGMNTGPFINVVQITDGYWSSTESATDTSRAWRVAFGDGYQTTFNKTLPDLHAIAVRDVAAVPEPGTAWLLASGLAGLAMTRRRKAKA